MTNNPKKSLLEQRTIDSTNFGGIDPLAILFLLKKNWYWLMLGLLVSVFAANFYIGHTMPIYKTSATILINETEGRNLAESTQMLQGIGLPGGLQNMENQIIIIRSRALIERTLKDLPFEIEYYTKTIRNQLPIYPNIPIKVLFDNGITLPRDTEFSIAFISNEKFIIKSEAEYFPFSKTATFGELIEAPGGTFTIACFNQEWVDQNRDLVLYFMVFSPIRLLRYYSSHMTIERASREGSVLRISLTGTNRAKDVDFLNKHVENFQAISLGRKNTEAERRIQFIDDQLVGISDSLSITETKLQQFRSSHRVMDLSAQGQALIGQVNLLESERARLNLEANYYDYLAEYLATDVTGELPIVPITMGINDPGLARLVEELSTLQSQLSARGAGEMNPLQRNLEQRIRTAKEALKETLNGLKRANSLGRAENQEQINKVNAQASALPVTERQLLGIQRKFRLNDELYTFLLETRAEQEMQKASNRADCEVIDPADARFSSMISPNRSKILFTAVIAGVGIPFLLLFIAFLLNNKVSEDEMKRLVNFPVVGNIPHNPFKSRNVVLDFPDTSVAESYRLLRTRLQFFIKDAVSPIILITSSMPEEGKTFMAINLASVYSLLGKRTILIGYDLRKPRIHKEFDISNDRGVSTWLIGQHKIQDIIQDTQYNCLSVIAAGPVPPNPSELIALEKTSDLFTFLKGKYDYIIVDSAPIGVVSDTLHLASLSDLCILIARPKRTIRDLFKSALETITSIDKKDIGLVVNDSRLGIKKYGYGEKFGYTNKNNKKRIWFVKKT